MISLFPALIIYSKLQGGKCLTYIGTEGFLGFGFTFGKNLKIKPTDESLRRLKDRIREITMYSRHIARPSHEGAWCASSWLDSELQADRDTDDFQESGWLDTAKAASFNGLKMDQQLPYSLQKSRQTERQWPAGLYSGNIPQGSMGDVEYETAEDCHVQSFLYRARVSEPL
jgi:hypothetical protein